jgi:hypothetical protein
MGASYYEARAILWILAKYNPGVSQLIQNPDRKRELTGLIEDNLKAISYGLSHDALDAIWEKIEDAGEVATAAPSGGAGPISIEAASYLAKILVLGPLAKKYYQSIEKSHPGMTKTLEVYQGFSNLPVLDSILTMIPEKGIAAIYAFLDNVYRIVREGKDLTKRYYERGKDYVTENYGKGVPGDTNSPYPHPLRPALAYQTEYP